MLYAHQSTLQQHQETSIRDSEGTIPDSSNHTKITRARIRIHEKEPPLGALPPAKIPRSTTKNHGEEESFSCATNRAEGLESRIPTNRARATQHNHPEHLKASLTLRAERQPEVSEQRTPPLLCAALILLSGPPGWGRRERRSQVSPSSLKARPHHAATG